MPGGSGSKRASSGCRAIGPQGLAETFDLILCNPPYIAEGAELGPGVREFEPDEALFAGAKGSTPIAQLARSSRGCSNQGGLAAIEIGPDQADAVTALLARDGLDARVARRPRRARPRALLLTWV